MKILLIQLRRVGDILLTTPVIPYLKQAYPNAQIDFLCEPMGRALIETNPQINELLIYNNKTPLKEILRIRSRRYDVVFDFLGNPRSAMLTGFSGARHRVGYQMRGRTIFYNCVVFGNPKPEYVPRRKVRLVEEWIQRQGEKTPSIQTLRPQLFLTEEEGKFARDWMAKEKQSPKSYVVIAPISRRKTREWKASSHRDLAMKIIQETGKSVYFIWGPGEEEDIQNLVDSTGGKAKMLPFTNLRQSAAILKSAALLVTSDSGSMHLAVSMGTPAATLYGPTRPIDWNPSLEPQFESREKYKPVFVEGLDCLGCHLNECPIGHLCMENLTVDTVFKAVRQLCENQNVEVSRG